VNNDVTAAVTTLLQARDRLLSESLQWTGSPPVQETQVRVSIE
jgi:hypothetical protein